MQIPKQMLVDIFGENIIDGHIAFINFCQGIKVKLPKHVTLDNVVQKIAVNRNYVLIAGTVFVHTSKLPELRKKLEDDARKAGASNKEIVEALNSLKSLPPNS